MRTPSGSGCFKYELQPATVTHVYGAAATAAPQDRSTTGVHQRVIERLLSLVGHRLGVPLHGEEKREGRVAVGLDDAIGRVRAGVKNTWEAREWLDGAWS